jgi:hypothetical protein
MSVHILGDGIHILGAGAAASAPVSGTVSTTDATPTTIPNISIALPSDDNAAAVWLDVVVSQLGSANAYQRKCFGVFKNSGGVVTLRGSFAVGPPNGGDAGLNTTNLQPVITGTTVTFQFVGIAATNLRAKVTVISINQTP